LLVQKPSNLLGWRPSGPGQGITKKVVSFSARAVSLRNEDGVPSNHYEMALGADGRGKRKRLRGVVNDAIGKNAVKRFWCQAHVRHVVDAGVYVACACR
jgi:transposase-like protein